MKNILVYLIGLLSLITIAIVASPVEAQASGAPLCSNPAKGVLQDWYGGTDTYLVNYSMNTVQIKNTSTACAYKVGIASYKAFEDYRISVYSQTYFASQTKVLQPGEKWTYTIRIPGCTYQTDVYWGDTITQFQKPHQTYSGQNRFLDGWYFPGNKEQQGKLPVCVKPTATPTPTPTPTPTATPTPSSTPTPTTSGEVLGSTPTPTPPTELPSTGPGLLVLTTLGGALSGLIAKKYWT